ncbi:BspA family leucine-rich repeat surface protein [archaeon]|nr:MAG: BspA family leucine-rich repeat surface protein [archaeon]
MSGMFLGVSSFNRPMGQWVVNNVIDMRSMLRLAATFSQPIGHWQVSSVLSLNDMFRYVVSFNRLLGQLDLGWVGSIDDMFDRAASYRAYIVEHEPKLTIYRLLHILPAQRLLSHGSLAEAW